MCKLVHQLFLYLYTNHVNVSWNVLAHMYVLTYNLLHSNSKRFASCWNAEFCKHLDKGLKPLHHYNFHFFSAVKFAII